MNKRMMLLLVIALFLVGLAGCACEHEWKDADCVNPKTCSLCEETEGAPLGHTWKAATCAAPKTCEICGATEGETLPHSYADATCTAPKTCKDCGATDGEALPHNYADATCAAPKTCKDCGATEGEALAHQWADATYSAPKTCSACAATEGEPLLRTDLGLDANNMASGLNQIMQAIGVQLTYLGNDENGWPVFDLVDATSNEATGVNVSFEPTQDGKLVYAIAIYTTDVNNSDAVSLMGASATMTLLGLEPAFDTQLFVQTLQGQPQIVENTAVYYMDSCGLAAEMQVSEAMGLIWIYPAE